MSSIIPANNKFIFKLVKKLGKPYLQRKYLSEFFSQKEYPPASKGKILIYAGIGYMYITPLEVLMYHILKLEGYEVEYYIYGKDVPINEVITRERIEKEGKALYWNRVSEGGESFLNAACIPFKYIEFPEEINELIKPVEHDLDKMLSFHFEGINFGFIIEGVMYRFYKSTNFGEDALLRARQFLQTSLANYLMVKKINQNNDFKYFFFSHGIYCTWQPVVEYCNKYHVDYVSYDRAKRKGTANFNFNRPSPNWEFKEAWERYKDRELNPSEEKLVDEYLGQRELQASDVYAYNTSKKANDLQVLKKRLNIPPGAKVISIFTNLIWDAANVSRDIAFSSALDCIQQTIQRFSNRPHVHILLRSHPAEMIIGTNERYGTLVREFFNNNLPANVTIIEPEDNINSFTVIDISDIGVVNTSTVGLEYAMSGKPIILISETHYRDKGFTHDAVSPEHYFTILDALIQGKNVLPFQMKLARKYFYMMMFLYQKNIPLDFVNNDFNGYSITNVTHFNGYEPFRKIFQSLEKKAPDFIFWD